MTTLILFFLTIVTGIYQWMYTLAIKKTTKEVGLNPPPILSFLLKVSRFFIVATGIFLLITSLHLIFFE